MKLCPGSHPLKKSSTRGSSCLFNEGIAHNPIPAGRSRLSVKQHLLALALPSSNLPHPSHLQRPKSTHTQKDMNLDVSGSCDPPVRLASLEAQVRLWHILTLGPHIDQQGDLFQLRTDMAGTASCTDPPRWALRFVWDLRLCSAFEPVGTLGDPEHRSTIRACGQVWRFRSKVGPKHCFRDLGPTRPGQPCFNWS